MELPNPDPVDGRPEHGGRDRHVAFTIQDLGPLKGRLDGAGVTYTMSKSGRAALFCRDLDGNAFEVHLTLVTLTFSYFKRAADSGYGGFRSRFRQRVSGLLTIPHALVSAGCRHSREPGFLCEYREPAFSDLPLFGCHS